MGNKTKGFLLKLNIITAISVQIINVVYGLLLPKYFLIYYGSEINGLVSSIQQYLGMISFCELGVGAVIQSALYRPLAKQDFDTINCIMSEARVFFRKIAGILCVYVGIMFFLYPIFINNSFGFITTSCLIIAVAVNLFSQYYFGLANQLLLNADQKLYVNYSLQIISTVLTAIISIYLIVLDFSIELVKLLTSLIFLLRPIFLYIYVKNHYPITTDKKNDSAYLTQKWNGVIHHISYVIVEHTDVVVLTIFSTLTNVSIYYVYYMVVSGIKALVTNALSGVQSLLGNLYVTKSKTEVNDYFDIIEWSIHFVSTLIFGITARLIVPFVKVYTRDIVDANYIVPAFGIILVFAHYMYCIRLPYFMVVKAAGEYKQTQTSAAIEAVLNIVVSIILVKKLGLIGVAIGTLVAMSYRTVYFVFYIKGNILNRKPSFFMKQIITDVVGLATCWGISSLVMMNVETYMNWIILALMISIISTVTMIIINLIFYPKCVKKCINSLKRKIYHKGQTL